MPIRHVGLYRFADHVDHGHMERLGKALDQLRDDVPGVRAITHGADAGVGGGAFDYVVIIDVGSSADWRTLRDYPAYILLTEELITPYIVEQAAGQLRIDEPAAAEPLDVDVRELSDDELVDRARRAAQASMDALLAEPDNVF